MTAYHQTLRHHVNQFFPQSNVQEYTWQAGKIVQQMPQFCVLCIKPKDADYFMYVSCGIAEHLGQEFFILSPHQTPEHVETLAMLASVSLDFPNSFGLGQTVDIGRSWVEQSDMAHFLISLPYPYG